MDILTRLPADLQERVLHEYEKCEKLRSLVRNFPIEFTMHFNNREIRLSTKIWCEPNNLVKCHFEIFWSHWRGWSYNLKNVPLGYISENNCLDICKRWKRAFFEYLRLNYTHGKRSFQNAVFGGFEVSSFSDAFYRTDRLKSKKLANIVKKSWFNININSVKPLEDRLKQIDNSEDFDCVDERIVKRFRMDDSCPDLGSDFVRVPYTLADLTMIQTSMPFIYKCLEDNNELWSPRYDLSVGMKRYIELYNQFHDKPETLPPSEEFNFIAQDVIHNDLGLRWYIGSYEYYSKYIVLPKIHVIMNWCS